MCCTSKNCNFVTETQTLHFSSEEEFFVWKQQEEARTFTYYVKTTSESQKTRNDDQSSQPAGMLHGKIQNMVDKICMPL